MEFTRISPKHQITIPKEAFRKLHLEVGDFLEVETTEEGLLLILLQVSYCGSLITSDRI